LKNSNRTLAVFKYFNNFFRIPDIQGFVHAGKPIEQLVHKDNNRLAAFG